MSFIVIEGLDGSGKSTQLKKLKAHLSDKSINYQYLHFPKVEDGIFGDLVARFLRGDLGNINEVDPYLVGLIYAGDRDHSKNQINEWINNNDLVIIDRYIYSNMAFQGAKLSAEKDKQELRDWLRNLEFNHYKIPQPDLSLFLDVPFTFTTQSLTNQREGEDRDYLKGKQDIHEADLNFQETVRQEYLDLVKQDENFHVIKCYNEAMEMLPPNEIFEKIINTLTQHNIL